MRGEATRQIEVCLPNGGAIERVMDASAIRYQRERIAHWDGVANWLGRRRGWGGSYQKRLIEIYRSLIPKNSNVLEIGCGEGDLLAAVEPSLGVGVDFSSAMLERARARHPDLQFIAADAQTLCLNQKFDVIILSDLVNDLWDVQRVIEQVAELSTSRTRVILNFHSRLWELPLRFARKLGMAKPNLAQNWLTHEDVSGLLALANFEVIGHRKEILLPLYLPLVTRFANRYLAKIWPFNIATLTHSLVARPVGPRKSDSRPPLVSLIIPARNEAGTIAELFARVPELGAGTELVFVEGGSTDDTYETIERAIAENPERPCLLLKQTGTGKGDAVRSGFQQASGDVLMILDADLTVPPENLNRFLEVLESGQADFVNGSRLVYPMEKQAMRFSNLVGNKFFSLAFSWLLGQPIKDTLCGTKVLWKADYEKIAANRAYFGDFDPFGDFELLFGAARLNLKILDLPVRYRDRTYGATNIQRWRHGSQLLKMVVFAARRIKFI